MRLLDLVEQHHRVGTAADRLGQLTTLVVTDVARRGTDKPCDGMLFAVFAHVDPDHRPLIVEQEVRQRLGQFGLADTGRAEEQEGARRAVGVGDPGPGATHGIGHRGDGLTLTDHPLAEFVLHAQQLGRLALEQPAGRDTGP